MTRTIFKVPFVMRKGRGKDTNKQGKTANKDRKRILE